MSGTFRMLGLPRAFLLAWVLTLGAFLGACSDSPSPLPTISVQPADTSAVAGTAAMLSVTASGPDLGYRWQRSNDGGTTWADIASATAAQYTLPATTLADHGARFRVVVTASGISLTSSAVQLTVTAAVVAPGLGVQPAAQSVTAPAAAVFSVTVTGTAPAYQWQRSTDNGATWSDIAGATGTSHDVGATDPSMNGLQYRVRVSNSAGSVTSAAATLSVQAAPVAAAFTTQPANQTVVAGSAAAFTVAATGTPAPTLQWQRSTDGGSTWVNIATATAATHNTGATTVGQNGERYRAVATNASGSVNSNAATLTVNPAAQAPAITTQPANQSVTAPATASFTAAASGVPTPSWQWQLSSDGGSSFANITGATSAGYTTPATATTDSGKRYRAVASNGSGSATTNAAVLTVNAVVTTGWQGNPTPLHTDGAAIQPELSANGAGQAIAVWSQNSGIYANRYLPQGGWEGRVVLSVVDPAYSFLDPTLAVNGNGQGVALWRQTDGGNFHRVLASVFAPASGWGAAATLSLSDTSGGTSPQTVLDANGNALAVWVQRASVFSPWQLFVSRFVAASSSWEPASRLDTDSIGEPTDSPHLAMNAGGDAFVVWPAPGSAPGSSALWSRRMAAGGSWGALVPLDSDAFGSPQQRVAVDTSGNAMVVFKKLDNPSFPSIWSTRFDAFSASWGTAVAVETNNVNRATAPQVAFDGNGQAVAAWVQYDGTQELILSNRHTVAGGWGTPQQVAAGAINRLASLSLAVNAGGTAVAAWRQDFWYVGASIQAPGAAWRTPQLASNTGSDGLGYDVSGDVRAGLDDLGNATVVWQGTPAGLSSRIYGGRFR